MFGERYFATRERLSDVIRGIASLAADTQTDLGGQLPCGKLKTGSARRFSSSSPAR